MNSSPSSFRSSLSKGQILSLPQGTGVYLNCLSGSIWLTEEADPRDQILETGESARLMRPGTALVMALRDSELSWQRCATRPSAGAHAGMVPRILSWLGWPNLLHLPRFAHWS